MCFRSIIPSSREVLNVLTKKQIARLQVILIPYCQKISDGTVIMPSLNTF